MAAAHEGTGSAGMGLIVCWLQAPKITTIKRGIDSDPESFVVPIGIGYNIPNNDLAPTNPDG